VNRSPITKQRSQWEELKPLVLGPVFALRWNRRVNDGVLVVQFSNDPDGLHLSISHRGHDAKIRRYPTWDEIADARDVFLPGDVAFAMILPVAGEYVALHDSTFHLHEMPERTQ
jgi:hypothetical protein